MFTGIINKMNGLHSMTCSLRSLAQLARIVFLSVIFSTLLAGCSRDIPSPPMTPELEATLLNRATERWHALEKKDFAAAYQYTTPKYRRIFSKALYVNKFSYAVDWELTDMELLNYDARAAVASVAVRVMSKPAKQTSVASNALGAIPLNIREKWIFVDGQWWNSARD
jgi:hypothetical protein